MTEVAAEKTGSVAVVSSEPSVGKVYASIEDILNSGANEVEYAEIEGFRPGETVRIGSVTAGDIIEWSEANEGEAKKTAGLRLLCKSLVGPAPANIRYANDDKNIAKFRTMRHNVTERIVRAIVKLNAMTAKEDAAAKKD